MKRISSPAATYRVTSVQFSSVSGKTEWTPAMNVYRCADRLIICLDMAGVDLGSVQVKLEKQTLRIAGRRQAPEPDCNHYKVLQILALEIDYGRFEREVQLPFPVSENGAKIEHREGFLWVEAALLER